ncbi:MAG: hypothetical protein A3J80_07655, partial [Desulfobacula sp. RIFOXYB2_FULL_45_6]
KISCISEDITFLAQSIKKIGLISPPVVRPMINNKFIIVSGFNRIRALCRNNEIKVAAYRTDKKTDDYQCLLFSIASLAFKRPLTHFELIISIKRLSTYLDKKEMANLSPVIFNMPLAQGFIGDLLEIGALPDPMLELIRTGNLSIKSAKKISHLEMDGITFFLNIFSKIKASVSIQLEIIQNILETAARDGLSFNSLFQEMKIQDILNDEDSDAVLRTQFFRSKVFEQRYPTLSRTRQTVQNKIASIKLPGTLKLTPPENFESRKYSVSFTANSYDDFQKNVHHLTLALENKKLKEIFNL